MPAGYLSAGPLHRGRGAGRLPSAGRAEQRQAHRGSLPDAASCSGIESSDTDYIDGEQAERSKLQE